jgi:hypothetical protein
VEEEVGRSRHLGKHQVINSDSVSAAAFSPLQPPMICQPGNVTSLIHQDSGVAYTAVGNG